MSKSEKERFLKAWANLQSMKLLIKSLSIMVLCFLSLCMGQVAPSQLKGIDLEVGVTRTFEFYENDTYIGYNQYTVTKKEAYNEKVAYFIESEVDLNSNSYSVHIEASYIVDTQGLCLHYEFECIVNGETQTMNADFTETSVHITASVPGKTYDEVIELIQNTFSLDNNMICQWDIMLSAVVLERGENFAAYAFAAQPMKRTSVTASVSEGTVAIQVAGKTWECLKLEFSTPAGYTVYVTEDGQLVKMENESGLVIVLKE